KFARIVRYGAYRPVSYDTGPVSHDTCDTGWATSLAAGEGDWSCEYSFFVVAIDLTDAGHGVGIGPGRPGTLRPGPGRPIGPEAGPEPGPIILLGRARPGWVPGLATKSQARPGPPRKGSRVERETEGGAGAAGDGGGEERAAGHRAAEDGGGVGAERGEGDEGEGDGREREREGGGNGRGSEGLEGEGDGREREREQRERETGGSREREREQREREMGQETDP
ncbi:Zinc-metallopeptidase, partial [Nymphaea thermarum]